MKKMNDGSQPWYVDAAVKDAKRRVKAQLNLMKEMIDQVETLEQAEVLLTLEKDLSIVSYDARVKMNIGGRERRETTL